MTSDLKVVHVIRNPGLLARVFVNLCTWRVEFASSGTLPHEEADVSGLGGRVYEIVS
jgi:hypothetical protein